VGVVVLWIRVSMAEAGGVDCAPMTACVNGSGWYCM